MRSFACLFSGVVSGAVPRPWAAGYGTQERVIFGVFPVAAQRLICWNGIARLPMTPRRRDDHTGIHVTARGTGTVTYAFPWWLVRRRDDRTGIDVTAHGAATITYVFP
jgi:hypothetical protein